MERISPEAAQKFVPDGFVLDRKFPRGGATCGEEHVRYMVKFVSPFVQSLEQVIVGQKQMIHYTALGLIAVGDRDIGHSGAGHIFFVTPFGTGKTLLAKVPALVLEGTSGRTQGGPDALPSDILGNRIIDFDENGKRYFSLIKGPAFTAIQLHDEVNRNTPRALAALLEIAGEGKITIPGEPEPFVVNPFMIFTANPVETAGTNPVPEALLDRIMFMMRGEKFTADVFTNILRRTRGFPSLKLQKVGTVEEMNEVRQFFHETIHVSSQMETFIGQLFENLDNSHRYPSIQKLHEEVQKTVIVSAPQGRGAIHLEGAARALAALRYRNFIIPDDVLKVLLPVIRHRTVMASSVLTHFMHEWKTRDSLEVKDRIITTLIQEAWRDAWQRCANG